MHHLVSSHGLATLALQLTIQKEEKLMRWKALCIFSVKGNGNTIPQNFSVMQKSRRVNLATQFEKHVKQRNQ